MKKFVLILISFYQKNISHSLQSFFGISLGCRFYPTCSEYSYKAVQELGIVKGMGKSIARIAKCNALFKGGIDVLEAKTLEN